ncbi:DUF4126 domain-containing protein [Krasilnikovia sp. M28-CT-15]|uniref:DUF4126 domain-containing protein n=1 Tax=Krasilnikovia sp. M28-CT-15 TaxID=3373540 RepID=UPI00399C5328
MLEALTGTGLAASAGLNAYIPLLTMGLLARFTDVVELPAGWQWLSGGWALVILAVLLAIEVVADKVPVVDHVNDVVQTVVRPAAGGLAFGAGAGAQTATVSDPGALGSRQWIAIAAGVLIALCVHGVKAASRPVVNATTGGLGAPVVSTVEDVGSAVMSVLAILMPILVLLALVLLAAGGTWVVRRRRRRRRQRRAVEGVETVRLFG